MSGLQGIRDRMACAAEQAGRALAEIELVAVSKTFPVEEIFPVYADGQRVFGESRQQEAEEKIAALPADIEWHFIGRLQRNKVRKILRDFSVLHAVDSFRLAKAISDVAGEMTREVSIFLQINVAQESSKGGFLVEEARDLLPDLLELPNVRVRGLMQIPPDDEAAQPWFAKLRELRDTWCDANPGLGRDLSMGMSGDFEQAIAEGATHIRVGSAIFGYRSYRVEGELG